MDRPVKPGCGTLIALLAIAIFALSACSGNPPRWRGLFHVNAESDPPPAVEVTNEPPTE